MPDAVIITRPRAQAEPLARSVAALGREVVVLPLLDIFPLDDDSALQAALANLNAYSLVAFVSPNAIDAALAHVKQWPQGVALAVLGEGSRVALASHGIDESTAAIISPPDPAHSDSEHLLGAMDLAALAGKRVLMVRGESGRELMAEGLRAAGASVDTVAAYRRCVPVLTPALAATLETLLARPNNWVITSSEALRGLLDLLERIAPGTSVAKMQHQHLIVPHARIAQTAQTLGLTRLTLTGSGDERLLAALQSCP
ncbi:MAG: uroporphyrinogen-III synthase [Pseudomonadota bacterium]